VIQANCRAQFTADDFSFVVRTLARSERDAVSLVSLLSDEAERDAILDHELVYRSLIDDGGCLRVSAAFYFYVLTRRVLRQVGLEERALTDYVAAVLLAFSRTSQLRATTTARPPRAASPTFPICSPPSPPARRSRPLCSGRTWPTMRSSSAACSPSASSRTPPAGAHRG